MAIVDNEHRISHIEDLPDDILRNIFGRLLLPELVQLRVLSRQLRDHVDHIGIPSYSTTHRQSHITLHPSPSAWRALDLVRYNYSTTIQSLRKHSFHAFQIGPTWRQSVIPTMTLTPDRLILGVGDRLLIHPLVATGDRRGKAAGPAREYMVAQKGKGSASDIVGTVDLGDNQIGVAQFDGTLQRFKLSENGKLTSTAHYAQPKGQNMHTLSASPAGDIMLTTTTNGLVSLFRTRSPWVPPETFTTKDKSRAWSSLVIDQHRKLPPTLFLGMSNGIAMHNIRPTGIEEEPVRFLTGPDEPLRSSPYDMALPPPGCVHHPSILLSAWYDTNLRIHDLRTPATAPVIACSDPWQWADDSAFYTCSYLAEYHIAAGGSRHGCVAIFDLRRSKSGWSAFTPGGKGSPVYALEGEGGRLWGVTEKRAFAVTVDGSGDRSDGIMLPGAKPKKERARERPSGWRQRGGKWGWTVRYDEEEETVMGYEHHQRGVALFQSNPVR